VLKWAACPWLESSQNSIWTASVELASKRSTTLPSITTANASSNYSMTRKLQSTFEVSGIAWLALRNHIPCTEHVRQLAEGLFMSSLCVKGRTESWVAHDRDQEFGDNETLDFGRSQKLRKEGNARINMVSALKPGLAKIIEKVHNSWYFEIPEADLHTADNACCIYYADTWSMKQVHWLSKRQSPHCSTY